MTQTIDLIKYKKVSDLSIFCVSDFTYSFEGYLMEEHHIWANGSVGHKD